MSRRVITQAIPQVQPPGRRRRGAQPHRSLRGVLIVLLIALAVVVVFLGNTLGWWHLESRPRPLSRLRRVTNQQVTAAESTLQAARVSMTTVQTEPSNASQSGVVLSTDPTAGTQVKKGQNITLDVGSGTRTSSDVVCPAVVGFTLRDAKSRC